MFWFSNLAIGYWILGKGAWGHSKVYVLLVFKALSLHDRVIAEDPWVPCSKPMTDNLEASRKLWSLAYLSMEAIMACWFALVMVPSLKWALLAWGGEMGIKFSLTNSEKFSVGSKD